MIEHIPILARWQTTGVVEKLTMNRSKIVDVCSEVVRDCRAGSFRKSHVREKLAKAGALTSH